MGDAPGWLFASLTSWVADVVVAAVWVSTWYRGIVP